MYYSDEDNIANKNENEICSWIILGAINYLLITFLCNEMLCSRNIIKENFPRYLFPPTYLPLSYPCFYQSFAVVKSLFSLFLFLVIFSQESSLTSRSLNCDGKVRLCSDHFFSRWVYVVFRFLQITFFIT